MPSLPPRPDPAAIAKKAKTALKTAKTATTSAAQAAGARVQNALDTLEKAPLAASRLGQMIQQFLRDRLAAGQDLDEFIAEAKAAAEKEIAKRRHIVSFLAEAGSLLRVGDRLAQLRKEVIQPVRSGLLQGRQAWERITAILATPYPFLTWAEQHVGKMTIGAALQASVGAGAGLGKAYGISGMRHCLACFFEQDSVCVGAVAGADFGAQLSVAPNVPSAGFSHTLEVSLGGGYGATGSVTVALIPTPHKPTKTEPWLFTYEFAGLAVSLGGGGGLNISIALGVTRSVILPGGALS